jgi:hypothetical protein
MALHQVQALFEQAQERRRCARVLSALFEIHDVLLLPREALTRLDDQPIGHCKMTIPSLRHQRLTSPLGALHGPMPLLGSCAHGSGEIRVRSPQFGVGFDADHPPFGGPDAPQRASATRADHHLRGSGGLC